MNRRQPVYLEKVVYNLRGGFLVRPLSITVALGFAGGALSSLEKAYPAIGGLVPRMLFPSRADHQVAQTILTTIASSVMTVVSIVFAIMLMSLTLASMQFSPRIIVSFTKDRVTQWTLGVFLGTFSYCVSALPAARSIPPFAPIATVTGAMLLGFICVVWLMFFIHHISQGISVNFIVDRIATETEAMIDEMMPIPMGEWTGNVNLPADERHEAYFVASITSGYIRHIDLEKLYKFASSRHRCIKVIRRVGHFVPEGVNLISISGIEPLGQEQTKEILSAFDIGPTRTLQQDVEFGVLQIVDVALRAISPAVNDPSTAICCIDHLSRILILFGSRKPPIECRYDSEGVLRLYCPVMGLDRMVHSAFDQIRSYSKGDAAVSLRMLRALSDVSNTVQTQEARVMLAEMGRRILTGVATTLAEEELKEMRARMHTLDRLARA